MVTDLPELDLDALDDDERWYLRSALGLIETGSMFHGRFVEVHVANLLGADLPTTGTNAWDLWLPSDPPITIEVKATPHGGSYSLSTKAADVWVFVTYASQTVRPREYSYAVASRGEVVAIGRKSISQRRLFDRLTTTPQSGLLATVKDAATRSSV